MFRRDFFKMLGAAAASVVCAPLVKLLPERKTATVRITHYSDVDLSHLEMPIEEFTERFVWPAWKKMADAIDAEALQRYHATADLKFLVGDEWHS